MIVIEGKSGKSRMLQNIINEQIRSTSIVILDSMNYYTLGFKDGVEHYIGVDIESLIDFSFMREFRDKDWIIFLSYLDLDRHDLAQFKEIERTLGKSIIITVNNDAVENAQLYYA